MGKGITGSSPTKPCEQCNALFKYKPSIEKRGHARFCGVICQRVWQSESKRGRKPYEITDANREVRRLIRLGKPNPSKGIPRPQTQGANNHFWKGEKASYRALHSWVTRKLGQPKTCTNCCANGLDGRQIHWANVSHKYQRNLDDWMRLCAKCHKAYDTGKLTLAQIGG